MSEYKKMQTVFKRDPDNNYKTLLWGEFSTSEFEFLSNCTWQFTEKVDGTNIRIEWDGENLEVKGRTDRAQIPPDLLKSLHSLFDEAPFLEVFSGPAILYGEGYGPKIQKGGGNYRDDPSFVLFDVMVGTWWLERPNVESVASSLGGIEVVPMIGQGSLWEMAELARNGIKSKWGDFQAEGIVARPSTELRTRKGDRIITKIKCKDFLENT